MCLFSNTQGTDLFKCLAVSLNGTHLMVALHISINSYQRIFIHGILQEEYLFDHGEMPESFPSADKPSVCLIIIISS